MGVNIYWIIVALVIILGLILPQEGKEKKIYIFIMAVVHIFVCGWRYIYLTGDLRRYAWGYYTFKDKEWFDESVWGNGTNVGFRWLCKIVSMLTDGDFHIFLIVLAIFTQVAVAVLIYRYSPKPWVSYLVWNCMSFYITYDFSALKQGLAMAILMYAMIAIFENKKIPFVLIVLLAGTIHAPSLVFLPAYLIANTKITDKSIIAYIISIVTVFIFKEQIASWGTDAYYADERINVVGSISLGGRFFVIVLIVLCGILLKGFRERRFEMLCNFMIVAATIQIFAGYSNVFTRFSDYYLQFAILFVPMIFYRADETVPINEDANLPPFLFDVDSLKFFVIVLTGILIWWYHVTCLSVEIEQKQDDFLNYRFQWEVEDDSYGAIEKETETVTDGEF